MSGGVIIRCVERGCRAMHIRVVGKARDVDVGVARLHVVKGEVVRQNALVGGKGAALGKYLEVPYQGRLLPHRSA